MDDILKKAEDSNRKLWDEITPVHVESDDYNLDGFKQGQTKLDEIQLSEMGDIRGKTLLHLQCHFGMDTLSWAREGAIVTGVDFSKKAIEQANALKNELDIPARFICCNLYKTRDHLDGQFDIVYTSQGVLCWLKDIDEWARIISHFLKPGGVFYIMEQHPIRNIFDDTRADMLDIIHPYFHRPEPTVWHDDFPDYSDHTYIPQNPSHEWTWSVSDILNALIQAGLRVEFFNEYDRLFFAGLPGMKQDENGWWYLPDHRGKLPLIFTLKAQKK